MKLTKIALVADDDPRYSSGEWTVSFGRPWRPAATAAPPLVVLTEEQAEELEGLEDEGTTAG